MTNEDTECLLKVILRSYRLPFRTQSNFARRHAPVVAMAASLGLITTRMFGQAFASEWRVTVKGLGFLVVHSGEEFDTNFNLDWGGNDD